MTDKTLTISPIGDQLVGETFYMEVVANYIMDPVRIMYRAKSQSGNTFSDLPGGCRQSNDGFRLFIPVMNGTPASHFAEVLDNTVEPNIFAEPVQYHVFAVLPPVEASTVGQSAAPQMLGLKTEETPPKEGEYAPDPENVKQADKVESPVENHEHNQG